MKTVTAKISTFDRILNPFSKPKQLQRLYRLPNSARVLKRVLVCFSGLIAMLLILLIANPDLLAQEWPQFRGPNGNGVIDKIEHPLEWSETKNVAWSVKLDGSALSSAVVVGDKVFMTNAAGPMKQVGFAAGVRNMRSTLPEKPLTFKAVCLSLKDGSEVWSKDLLTKMPKHGIHPSNSFATATPVTDGKHVFVYFASAGLVAALDLDGNEVWKKKVGAYPTGNGFGPGSSLAIYGDNVFVQCDNDQASFIVAFKKSNGKKAWRKKRDSRTSWSTPLVWTNKARVELIVCGSGFVTSYKPESGEENWSIDGVDSAFSASPAADSERIYLGNSGPRSNGPLLAIGSEMKGKQTFQADGENEGLAWAKMQAGPGMPSPVSIGGYVYVTRRGIMTCYAAADGNQIYKTRIDGLNSAASSLWADKDRLFIIDEEGQTFVIQAGPAFKVIGVNKLDDLVWSTPSVAGKSLLIRSASKLYCIRK